MDIRELADENMVLQRESAKEMSGPCPKCGDADRFHCAADWWFCRHRHGRAHRELALVRRCQTCKLVHDYLAAEIKGRFVEYQRCKNYASGVCAGTGGAGMLCLFHEPDTPLAWGLARRWQRVQTQDGTVALRRRRQ